MSSLAQEEARSISENVTWGHRKRLADGKVSLAYSRFLGYDKGNDGNLVKNEEEAKTIRLIFKLFLEGYSFHSIAKKLTDDKIKTPAKKDKWNRSTVESILTNEKYMGDALLQKSFTVDFLTKKHKKNEGEVPQYYVKDNHEPIVSKEVFELTQVEIQKRTKMGVRYSGVGLFSNKIKCGECGSFYGAKVWHSNDKYKRIVYRCNHKYGKSKICNTPHITEEEIKTLCVDAINKVIKNKSETIRNVELIINKVCKFEKIEKEKNKLYQELCVITEMQKNLIDKNTKVAQDQTKYNKEFEEITSKYEKIKLEYENKEKEMNESLARKKQLNDYVEKLKKSKIIKEFDEILFAGLIEEIVIFKQKKEIVFKDGKKIIF